MDVKSVLFQLISLFDIVAVAFTGWMVLISFFEANFWHFTDPAVLGVSVRALVLLFLAFVVTPVFLSWKKLRLLKLNSVLLFLLKVLLALPLLISSLIPLHTIPWARTGLLTFGVALLPFVVSWILSRSSECSTSPKSPSFDTAVKADQHPERNEAKYLSAKESFDSYIDIIILTAILFSMSIRYNTATINVFYEDWRFSCSLFVFVSLLALLNSILIYVQNKTENKAKPTALSSTIAPNGQVLPDHSSSSCMTNETILSDSGKSTASLKHEKTTYMNGESAPNKSKISSKSNPHILNWSSSATVILSGCVHGITIGGLVVFFVWIFSTPHLLCRWSGLEPYYNGVFVVLGLMLGIFFTLLVRPETLCFATNKEQKETLSNQQTKVSRFE